MCIVCAICHKKVKGAVRVDEFAVCNPCYEKLDKFASKLLPRPNHWPNRQNLQWFLLEEGMKLLTQRVGGVTRECNSRCYAAEAGSRCTCCCKGANHAVGEQKALMNVSRMLRDDNLKGTDVEVTRKAERAIRRMEVSA